MNSFIRVSLVVFVFSGIFAAFAAGQSLNGVWDGTVKYDDYRIPFPIEFTQRGESVTPAFFNGDDRVTSTAGTLAGNALNVNFDHYATHLTATVANDVIQGTYGNTKYGFHDFEARPHQDAPALILKLPTSAEYGTCQMKARKVSMPGI